MRNAARAAGAAFRPARARVLPCRGGRSLTGAPGPRPAAFAVAFDIDGVLYRGGETLPEGPAAVAALRRANIPHIFVTNGGGHSEEERAEKLGARLGLEVDAGAVQLAHTPMRKLAAAAGKGGRRVLVVGPSSAAHLARDCGLEDFVTAEELWGQHPRMWPDEAPPAGIRRRDLRGAAFEAVWVVFPPDAWYRDLQIIIDVARSGGAMVGERGADLPIHCAGPDLEYPSEWPLPRLGAGAFLSALEALYAGVVGRKADVRVYGKPHRATFDYAEDLLARQCGGATPERIYMVGDNPRTDIRGANGASGRWRSVLVHTGMFRPEDHGGATNDARDPADFVAANALEAVEMVLAMEGTAAAP